MTGDRASQADLATLFAAILAEEPGLPALIQGREVLTYAAWWRESGIAGSELAGRGVAPGDVVALLRPRGDIDPPHLHTVHHLVEALAGDASENPVGPAAGRSRTAAQW